MTDNLSPCPFCGGSRLENCTDDGRHWVRCMGCDATGPLGSKYDEEPAPPAPDCRTCNGTGETVHGQRCVCTYNKDRAR